MQMSSQGKSSVMVFSRAAFAPISGDPLSREVFKPRTSSIEFALEVTSRPVVRGAMEPSPEITSGSEDRGATEPAQEAVSILGRQGDEEVEEVALRCGDLQSLIMPEECT